MKCPLCHHHVLNAFHEDKRRLYMQCEQCALVSVPDVYHLSSNDEYAVYCQHENSPEDSGYRQFLSRLCTPLLQHLPVKSHGLDFGCGPGPALAHMLMEQGHTVTLYDLYFFNDLSVFNTQYDFITATEVIEHLAQPLDHLDCLWRCLKPQGKLGIMTKLVRNQQAFSTWHYKNDPTHICFFSKKNLAWLAEHWQAELEYVADDAFIFHKSE